MKECNRSKLKLSKTPGPSLKGSSSKKSHPFDNDTHTLPSTKFTLENSPIQGRICSFLSPIRQPLGKPYGAGGGEQVESWEGMGRVG